LLAGGARKCSYGNPSSLRGGNEYWANFSLQNKPCVNSPHTLSVAADANKDNMLIADASGSSEGAWHCIGNKQCLFHTHTPLSPLPRTRVLYQIFPLACAARHIHTYIFLSTLLSRLIINLCHTLLPYVYPMHIKSISAFSHGRPT
jgi:hypothetical protein